MFDRYPLPSHVMIDDERIWNEIGKNSSVGKIVWNVPVTRTVIGSSGLSVLSAAVGLLVG